MKKRVGNEGGTVEERKGNGVGQKFGNEKCASKSLHANNVRICDSFIYIISFVYRNKDNKGLTVRACHLLRRH